MTVHTRFLSSFGFTIKFIFLKKKLKKKNNKPFCKSCFVTYESKNKETLLRNIFFRF